MKVEYYNRYGDLITFMQLSDGNISMMGGEYCRMSADTYEDALNSKYNMVDPSGGPYICGESSHSNATDMGIFHKEWKGKLVDYIIPNGDSFILVIK
jgi:hypothetical protein